MVRMKLFLLIFLPGAAALVDSVSGKLPHEDCSFHSSYPKQYLAYKTSSSSILLDGKLDEMDWQLSSFSDEFVDISTTTTPKYSTRMKILWNDDYLFIGGFLMEPNLCGNITSACHCNDPSASDQVIFHDNDFEVFVDVDGNNHFYKEFEMNVFNATWDLQLNKPYADGGYENSSRVYGEEGFDMQPPLRCNVFVNGTINDPAGPQDRYWTVEIAIPLKSLVENEIVSLPPQNNSIWRINFSRVEWNTIVNDKGQYIKQPSCQSCPVPGTEAEDNWVWSPQGEINMHAPEKWGMLQLLDLSPSSAVQDQHDLTSSLLIVNPEWPVRSLAMVLYYAQRGYYGDHQVYSDDAKELDQYATQPILSTEECSPLPIIELVDGGKGYRGIVSDLKGGYRAEIRDDRLLIVSKI
jgi:hypothetical protein